MPLEKHFSDYYNYESHSLQHEDITDFTRNKLWNIIYEFFRLLMEEEYGKDEFFHAMEIYWDHFGLRITRLPKSTNTGFLELEKLFSSLKWYKVFDFLEITGKIVEMLRGKSESDSFKARCSACLRYHNAPYGFVGEYIVPMMNEFEKYSVETVIEQDNGASYHLEIALKNLSERKNSECVREAILAVEATLS